MSQKPLRSKKLPSAPEIQSGLRLFVVRSNGTRIEVAAWINADRLLSRSLAASAAAGCAITMQVGLNKYQKIASLNSNVVDIPSLQHVLRAVNETPGGSQMRIDPTDGGSFTNLIDLYHASLLLDTRPAQGHLRVQILTCIQRQVLGVEQMLRVEETMRIHDIGIYTAMTRAFGGATASGVVDQSRLNDIVNFIPVGNPLGPDLVHAVQIARIAGIAPPASWR